MIKLVAQEQLLVECVKHNMNIHHPLLKSNKFAAVILKYKLNFS